MNTVAGRVGFLLLVPVATAVLGVLCVTYTVVEWAMVTARAYRTATACYTTR